MKYRVRMAEQGHPIHLSAFFTADTDLPTATKSLISRWNLADVTGAVIAEHPIDGLVGWFRFVRHRRNHIEAVGTWVATAHRHQGLATKMWNVALQERVAQVSVCVYTRGGGALVDRLRTAHPTKKWNVHGTHAINPDRKKRKR